MRIVQINYIRDFSVNKRFLEFRIVYRIEWGGLTTQLASQVIQAIPHFIIRIYPKKLKDSTRILIEVILATALQMDYTLSPPRLNICVGS
jgi:hypothetical protein